MPLPMIYKNGYLTIKDYNHSVNTYLSDFQNNEFIPVLANDYLKPRKDVNNWIQDVVDTLDKDDIEQFRKLLSSFLVAPLTPCTAKKRMGTLLPLHVLSAHVYG